MIMSTRIELRDFKGGARINAFGVSRLSANETSLQDCNLSVSNLQGFKFLLY